VKWVRYGGTVACAILLVLFGSACSIEPSGPSGKEVRGERPSGAGASGKVVETGLAERATEVVSTAAVQRAVCPLLNDGTWRISASSVENEELLPERAADGDLSTRWSSSFRDGQFWQVEFPRPEILRSTAIHWEDAYARSYALQVSEDGEAWQTVHECTNGNGGVDLITFGPVTAQWFRIECRKRATEWGFSIREVVFNGGGTVAREAYASSGTGEFAARNALDGDPRTRWSSNFTDDEWWAVRFATNQWICGLDILWETAFGEEYQVLVSPDGREWRCVYHVKDGDGNRDILFFGPVSARELKLKGIRRGTGWGYSIWEIELLTPPFCPQASASDELAGHPATMAIDGDTGTWWAASRCPAELCVRLPRKMDLGGLDIRWGPSWADRYSVAVSEDLSNWVVVAEKKNGNGGRDLLYFPRVEARAVKILCRNAAGGCSIANLELKSGGEQADPLKEYRALAVDLPAGLFPRWLRREQEYWTVTGIPEDNEESLLGESGIVEPRKEAFCVQPLVRWNGKLYTWADAELRRGLEDGYLPLPWVSWHCGDWELSIRAVTTGEPGASCTWVRYQLESVATAAVPAELILAVRPLQLNPVWQRGGFSPIRAAAVVRDGDRVSLRVNGRVSMTAGPAPRFGWVMAWGEGEVAESFLTGEYPDTAQAEDAQGRVSAALVWRGAVCRTQSLDVVVCFPLEADSPAADGFAPGRFSAVREAEIARWRARLGGLEIHLPEQRLVRILRSNLAYILINQDGPWIKPGPRNYNHAWIRDGSMTAAALWRAGLADRVKAYAEAYTRMVRDDGWVPFIILENGKPVGFNPDLDKGEGHEYDSQGEYPYLVSLLAAGSGDRPPPAMVDKAVAAIRFLQSLRKLRMTEEYCSPEKRAYYGILPASNSHEGYYPARHSYWDDFWGLRGMAEAVRLCRKAGRLTEAAEIEQWRRDFTACVRNSLAAVMKRAGIRYVPGCVELADKDPTSTAIAVNLGVTDAVPPGALSYTYRSYFEELQPYLQDGKRRTYTPYEVRNVEAMVRLGMRREALQLLRYLVRDAVFPPEWNHMAEVVHARRRAPSYIGDMPHTWVGSGYVNAVLSLLAYEEGERLVLGAGISPDWVTGSEKGVSFSGLITRFGSIAGRIWREGDDIRLMFDGKAFPPGGFRFAVPEEWRNRRLFVGGEDRGRVGASLHFASLPYTCLLREAEGAAEDDQPIPEEAGASGTSNAAD